MKETIAIDMDGVLANNQAHYIDYYAKETGIQVDPTSMNGLAENESLPDPGAIRRYIYTAGFFSSLPVMPDAQEVVKILSEQYKVYVVSAAMEFPHSLGEKYAWLGEHFPFIHWTNIVFCGDKSLIKTDYLIDDHEKNLKTFVGKPILFNAFHNVNVQHYERVMSWKDLGERMIKR